MFYCNMTMPALYIYVNSQMLIYHWFKKSLLSWLVKWLLWLVNMIIGWLWFLLKLYKWEKIIFYLCFNSCRSFYYRNKTFFLQFVYLFLYQLYFIYRWKGRWKFYNSFFYIHLNKNIHGQTVYWSNVINTILLFKSRVTWWIVVALAIIPNLSILYLVQEFFFKSYTSMQTFLQDVSSISFIVSHIITIGRYWNYSCLG